MVGAEGLWLWVWSWGASVKGGSWNIVAYWHRTATWVVLCTCSDLCRRTIYSRLGSFCSLSLRGTKRRPKKCAVGSSKEGRTAKGVLSNPGHLPKHDPTVLQLLRSYGPELNPRPEAQDPKPHQGFNMSAEGLHPQTHPP